MKTNTPRFSPKTLQFLQKAGRQKRPDWLERNRAEYEKVLLEPLQHLAGHLKAEIGKLAPSYHFPQKGIGRLKRPANRVAERGGSLYKNWMSYSAARPRESRFTHNPNLFFLINMDDPVDNVLVAGGLYMPSSPQTRALREAIAKDATPFDELFADKAFARCFAGGFSDERISTRLTRGFAPDHPRMDWLRLQAFFVWRPYSKREFASAEFAELVARDWKQVLRLNDLLEKAIRGHWPPSAPLAVKKKKLESSRLLDRLEDLERFERKMDF